MKNLLILILVTICLNAYAKEDPDLCTKQGMGYTLFTLNIYRTFDGVTEFQACKRYKSKTNILFVTGKTSKSIAYNSTKLLSESQFNDLETLYDRALDLNLRDHVEGADGSTWCLEAKMYPIYKACFWSPDKSDERHLIGLYNLGKHLWEITNQEKEYGELY
jgi:hypothetical protein